MTPVARAASGREPLHGVRQIVRFNWPFYAAAVPIALLVPFAAHRLPIDAFSRGVIAAAAAMATLWASGSLVASWIVYDRSGLMKGDWISEALGFRPRTWINIHAGFDETTVLVQKAFAGAKGRVFDVFDPIEMTEPSIARARDQGAASLVTESVDYRRLPAGDASAEAIMLLLSAHELRSDDARSALLAEARRVLTGNGRIIVAEHLRDIANFVAFGPGFLHFHSRRTWTRGFRLAGLVVRRELSITPFVRAFVLEKRA